MGPLPGPARQPVARGTVHVWGAGLEHVLRASPLSGGPDGCEGNLGDQGEPLARLKSRWGRAYVQQLREEDASLP